MVKEKDQNKVAKRLAKKIGKRNVVDCTQLPGIPPQYLMPLDELKTLPEDTIFTLLDIGAGTKELKKFLPENIKYFSLDIQGPHNLLVNLDHQKIPLRDNSVDIIMCMETLEHIQNPNKVMEELKRIAKDDAWFFISMPNEYNFWLRLLYMFGVKDSMKEPFQIVNKHLHIHLPRVKDIKRFLSGYLDIEKVYYGWNSYRAPKFLNGFLTNLARIWPSMFTRFVVIKGLKKELPIN